jgi:hypothetical protein
VTTPLSNTHNKSIAPTRLEYAINLRAAGLAVPFERPKLAVTATAMAPLYDLLQERRRQGKIIEQDPEPAA